MAPNNIRWTTPGLQRYRAAIIALTALAAGCTIYYVHESLRSTRQAPQKGCTLHRSNARRRRRSRLRRGTETASEDASPSPGFLSNEEENRRVYGWHAFRLGNGDLRTVPLTRQLLDAVDAAQGGGFSDEEAVRLREELQPAFLNLYFYRHLRSIPFTAEQERHVVEDLQRDGGFSADSVQRAAAQTRNQRLRQSIDSWIESQRRVEDRPMEELVTDPFILEEVAAARQTLIEQNMAQDTVQDTESEASWGGNGDTYNNTEGQSLLDLLYRIAEEQARREGFVHRGITCNGCSAHPINGIRYRCANCADFDLCEACEALQIHPKTHLFYKVRIPRSHLGHQPQQIKYPGKYSRHSRGLSRDRVIMYSKETGYKTSEIEGLWEQFRCLAATDWPADPLPHKIAIDRHTFEQMFLPSNWARPPPPSLIYDRVFSFYDTNNDNLIGFEELLVGLSNLNKRGPKEKWARIFKGYDIDGDGYVSRKDFLRMFKAHYALTKEMTREMIAGMEEDGNDDSARDLITGGQPLSSAFTQSPPIGQESRIGEGKGIDEFGDLIVYDEKGAVQDVNGDDLDIDEIIGQQSEAQTSTTFDKGTDIQAMVRDIYNDPWPPRFVLTEDVTSVLHELVDPAEITDDGLQASIREACHKRTAMAWHNRQIRHRQALTDRRKKSLFYDSDAAPSQMMRPSGSDGPGNILDPLGRTPTRECVKRLVRLGRTEDIFRSIEQLMKGLDWPISDPRRFRSTIFVMANLEWTGQEMLEAFKGYTVETVEIEEFVRNILRLFDDSVPPSPQEIESNSPARAPRRSRSSSKVRFEDGLTPDDGEHETRSLTSLSSRSVLVNERWGGFEVPEPEEDVGREVLFQVTREAMNELLDPIFKLREDLWLEAQDSKAVRQRFRAAISGAVDQPKQIWEYLNYFQKQHRIKSDYSSPNEFYLPTEAIRFRSYVDLCETSESSELTTEPCPSCKDARISFGKACHRCGSPSIQMKLRIEDEKGPLAVENCRTCLEHGIPNTIKPGDYCCVCGTPSKDRMAEDARLWCVISGCDDWSSRRNISGDSAANTAAPLPAEDRTAQSLADKHSAPSTEHTVPIANGGIERPAPHMDEQLTPPPVTQTVEEEASPPYPTIALEPRGSIRSFNEANLSIEDEIAQKPLNDLLKEAGYASVDELALGDTQSTNVSPAGGPSRSRTPPPDPILPQNRPNSARHCSFERSASPPSLSLNTEAEGNTIPSGPSQKDEGLPPDVSTLKYWATLYLLEDEDEKRGGPGRISEQEFIEIMLGERGIGLEFLGEWMNLTTF
ncbi:MAG: hypothetical protein Q9163_002465 [Psora crenata]